MEFYDTYIDRRGFFCIDILLLFRPLSSIFFNLRNCAKSESTLFEMNLFRKFESADFQQK